MGCVEGRGRPGVVYGRVVLLLALVMALAATTASDGLDGDGGTVEDCVVYQLQEGETSLVSSFDGGEIVLGVHTAHSSKYTLSGLAFQFNTEHDSLKASFTIGESKVYCANKPHFSTNDVYYNEYKTWWQHVTVSMKNNILCVDGSPVCPKRMDGFNPNLTVQSDTGQALIVFNCQSGCPTLDDASVTSLDQLPYERQIHVKNTSPDAKATLRLLHPCDSSGQTKDLDHDPCDEQHQEDMSFTASALNGDWNRLFLRTTEISKHNTTENITVVTAGEMMDIFITKSNYGILKVVNSTNMLWAVDCDPRVQPKVCPQTGPDSINESSATQAQVTNNLTDDGNMADSEGVCQGGKGYWKCIAVFVILMFFFILLSSICGIFIYKHLKKRMKALRDNEGHVFVDKSEHSYTSQSLQLQPSNASCSSSVLISNSNNIHNGHSVITSRSLSTDEDNVFPRKFPPPPSTPPPHPKENQDSMHSKSLVFLESTVQEHTDNMDDDEHDYDYVDINLLKQQLDKDKEDEERKKQMGEEENKMEVERNMNMKIDKDLSHYNSENSLYEPFSCVEAGGILV